MPTENNHPDSLLRLILPPEIFEYFEIINLEIREKEVHVHLDEKNVKPEGYELVNLISKGFHKSIIIQDFPIRDKALFLHIRRRRWFSESTKKTVERDWEIVAKGTRLTKEFATFLKGVFRELSNKQ